MHFVQANLWPRPLPPVNRGVRELVGVTDSEFADNAANWNAFRSIVVGEVIDLADTLGGVNHPVYFDEGHTNELGARLVARAMCERGSTRPRSHRRMNWVQERGARAELAADIEHVGGVEARASLAPPPPIRSRARGVVAVPAAPTALHAHHLIRSPPRPRRATMSSGGAVTLPLSVSGTMQWP